MTGDSTRGVITFDALGTLVRLKPPAPTLRRRLRDRLEIEVSEAQAERAIAAEIAYYRQHLDEGRDSIALAGLRSRCAEVLRSALPVAAQTAPLPALTEVLLCALEFSAYPDAQPALSAARRRGQRLVVVSNWDASLHEVLERLGLAALLDGIVTSAQAGARKPSPAIFNSALALVGDDSQQAVHVGDSVEEDVAGAVNAGIEPILLRRDGRSGPPGVRTIASLADLENVGH